MTYPRKTLKTAKASADNQAPVLSAIGAKRISAGSLIQFTLQATDLDDGDTLVYSAGNLPDGAAFNTGTGLFQWPPGGSDAGIHRVLFSVSDGDQADSEEVAVLVEYPRQPAKKLPVTSDDGSGPMTDFLQIV